MRQTAPALSPSQVKSFIQHFELPTYYHKPTNILRRRTKSSANPIWPALPHIQYDSLMALGQKKQRNITAWPLLCPQKRKIWNYPPRCYSLMLSKRGLMSKFWWKWPISSLAWSCGMRQETAIWPPRITMSSLYMANKTVTKGFGCSWFLPVPAGAEFTSLEDGLAYYPWLRTDKLLSNQSQLTWLGIPSSKNQLRPEAYRAFEIAFSEDAVLVEEFIAGTGVPLLCLRRSVWE